MTPSAPVIVDHLRVTGDLYVNYARQLSPGQHHIIDGIVTLISLFGVVDSLDHHSVFQRIAPPGQIGKELQIFLLVLQLSQKPTRPALIPSTGL